MTDALKSTTESVVQRLRTNCCRTLLTVAAVCLLAGTLMAHPGSGIAVDRGGQVYFLDTGSGLWKIDTRGKLTKLSGLKPHWLAIDASNRFANTPLPTGALGEISRVGDSPTFLLLSTDWPIAIGQDGNLYYQSGRPGDLRLMRMTPDGAKSVFVTLPKTVKGEPLPHISGIVAGPDGSLYYTEESAIRRITADGRISTAATVRTPVRPPSSPGSAQQPSRR